MTRIGISIQKKNIVFENDSGEMMPRLADACTVHHS